MSAAYSCHNCKIAFVSASDKFKHLHSCPYNNFCVVLAHQRPEIRYSCNICKSVFRTKRYVIRHIRTCITYKYSCKFPNCKKVYKSGDDLRMHELRAKHIFVCKKCDAEFIERKLFDEHNFVNHCLD